MKPVFIVISFLELITVSVPPCLPIALSIGIGKNLQFIFIY